MSDGNDLLMSGGRPWAAWAKIGDVVTGTIVSPPTARQSRDFDTQEPAFWDDEKKDPKMEVLVIIQTSTIDPDIEGDNGERSLVLPKGSQRFRAVQTAIRKAGANGFEVGGVISVKYTGDGEKPKRRGALAPKLYTAEYTAPVAAAAGSADEEAALNALAGLVGG